MGSIPLIVPPVPLLLDWVVSCVNACLQHLPSHKHFRHFCSKPSVFGSEESRRLLRGNRYKLICALGLVVEVFWGK